VILTAFFSLRLSATLSGFITTLLCKKSTFADTFFDILHNTKHRCLQIASRSDSSVLVNERNKLHVGLKLETKRTFRLAYINPSRTPQCGGPVDQGLPKVHNTIVCRAFFGQDSVLLLEGSILYPWYKIWE